MYGKHMKTKESYVIFAPNRSGFLHIGNALALSLAADEAERLGVKVLEILDPIAHWNTEYGDVDRAALAVQTEDSLKWANELLDVPLKMIIERESRMWRYMRTARKLVKDGVAIERPNGTIVLKDAHYIDDEVYGRVWQSSGIVVYRGVPWDSLVGVVDSIDFDVPVWIDDVSMTCSALEAKRLWPHVTDRPFPRCRHVPTICDATGAPLSKRSGPDLEYLFHNWAEQFPDAETRRGMLRNMIMTIDDDGITVPLKAEDVHITPRGLRVGHTALREIGQYEDREGVLV